MDGPLLPPPLHVAEINVVKKCATVFQRGPSLGKGRKGLGLGPAPPQEMSDKTTHKPAEKPTFSFRQAPKVAKCVCAAPSNRWGAGPPLEGLSSYSFCFRVYFLTYFHRNFFRGIVWNDGLVDGRTDTWMDGYLTHSRNPFVALVLRSVAVRAFRGSTPRE